MNDMLMFWAFSLIMFATGLTVGYNWRRRQLEEEIETLREFVLWVHKDECSSLLASNAKCDCGYAAIFAKENRDG